MFLIFGDDVEAKKKKLKQAKILNSLDHPNIVGFKGVCCFHKNDCQVKSTNMCFTRLPIFTKILEFK